jgi:glycosyltransferase involved in cell wall biosynthesis
MAPRPLTIVLCANQAWNLVNFRSGLIKALKTEGFRIVAVAPADAEMEARLTALGCKFVPVEIDAAGLSPLRDLRTAYQLYKIIREQQPAAWLSWTIKPNVYGSFVARLLGVPALPNISGLGTAFISRSPLTLIAKLLYRIGFARAQTVFFQNTEDRDHFLREGLVRPGQARVLPGSGIDTAFFSLNKSTRTARRHFLMISRLVADKGVREYAAAAAIVREKWPDARFRLIGPGAVANRTAIGEDELQGWIADGAIEYAGSIDDVRSAIEAADFVVLPSYREGLSRVLLEAGAMGRPAVTTDVPGCRDIVTDGINGYLCEARDAASLANALERAAATEDEAWQAMARAGRERVASEFSAERVNALYLAALADVREVAGRAPG